MVESQIFKEKIKFLRIRIKLLLYICILTYVCMYVQYIIILKIALFVSPKVKIHPKSIVNPPTSLGTSNYIELKLKIGKTFAHAYRMCCTLAILSNLKAINNFEWFVCMKHESWTFEVHCNNTYIMKTLKFNSYMKICW